MKPPRRRLPLGPGARLAFASGALVLGFEVLLLRRLPFWLEGLQPTLSGVLAACLLGLTLGAGPGTWLLHRLAGRLAPQVALAGAVAMVAASLHEVWVPPLSRLVVGSPEESLPLLANGEVGLHLRVVLASLAAGALPCFLLGAVVPLLLARLRHRDSRPALAGRLFFWQGVGAVAGALWVSQLCPWIAPVAFYAFAPVSTALGCALLCGRAGSWPMLGATAWVVLAALGVGPPDSLLGPPSPPIVGSRYDRSPDYEYLAARSDSSVTASVVYDRRRHSMVLFTDGFRAAETGPGTAYMKALGHLPMLLRDRAERAAVIALGTGTTADALATWPQLEAIDVVEISPAVLSLVDYFAGDGPGEGGRGTPRFLADRRTTVHVTDGRRYLARQQPESLDLVTIEPLLPYAPGTGPLYTAEFYQLAARALRRDGLMVQWLPTHAMPRDYFEILLATFARCYAHSSVWLVDQSTIIVGSRTPHLPDAAAWDRRYAALPESVRAALHESGLARPVDARMALVGGQPLAVCGTAPSLRDDRPALEGVAFWSGERQLRFFADNLEVLVALAESQPEGDRELAPLRARRLEGLQSLASSPFRPATASRAAVLSLAEVRGAVPDSVLVHREETAALRVLMETEVVQREGRAVLQLARRHLQRDGRSALLHAAVASDAPSDDVRRSSLEIALALDPALFGVPLSFLQPLEELRVQPPSWLRDVGVLESGAALLARATGVGGAALCAVFPTRVARAAVEVLRGRPLDAAETTALLHCVDPLSLDLAAQAIAARGGNLSLELFPLWRSDLPLPEIVLEVRRDAPAERVELARGLSRHRGARAREALARLLLDASAEVRAEAEVTLRETWGDRSTTGRRGTNLGGERRRIGSGPCIIPRHDRRDSRVHRAAGRR